MKIGIAILVLCLWLMLPAKADDKENSQFPLTNLVVSFRSECCGPDRAAIDRVNHFIAEFELTHQIHLKFDKTAWGREGEFDYCFDLSDTDESLALALAEGLRKQTQESHLVSIIENEICN